MLNIYYLFPKLFTCLAIGYYTCVNRTTASAMQKHYYTAPDRK